MDGRQRIQLVLALAFVLGAVALAVAGLSFAAGARDLARVSGAAQGLIDPPTVVRADPVALVHSVRDLARLETASVELEQRVRGQRGTDGSWSWVGERLLFIARGEVTAGVDLAQLGEQDLWVDGQGTVHVRLPPAHILRVDLDQQASFVAARERGWFGWTDVDLETEVRREAERALREAAAQGDLVDRAQDGAERAVGALLRQAGAQRVVFEPGAGADQ